MTSHEFPDFVAPADTSAEIDAMLDTDDDPDRHKATPREVAGEAYDFLNGETEVTFGEGKKHMFTDHDTHLASVRAAVEAAQAESEEAPDPEALATQQRLEAHVSEAQNRQPSGVVRAAVPKDSSSTEVKVKSEYL